MIQGLLALTLLTACLAGIFWILQRMTQMVVEAVREDHARRSFPWHRERLEWRFIQALERRGPQESQCWARACWDREICWARDRATRSIIVLVGVEIPEDLDPEMGSRKMAVFEYRAGTWRADGRCIDSPTSLAACEVAQFDAITPPSGPQNRP